MLKRKTIGYQSLFGKAANGLGVVVGNWGSSGSGCLLLTHKTLLETLSNSLNNLTALSHSTALLKELSILLRYSIAVFYFYNFSFGKLQRGKKLT